MKDILTSGGAKHERGRSNSPASGLVSVEESIGDIRSALLAFATLIVSVTYQSVLEPPSFTIKVDDNSTKGFLTHYASWVTRPLGRYLVYVGFIIGNTFGFLLSIQMIICVTRNLPVRLPLLLSVTALIQTYCCFTYFLPFTLPDKAFGLKNMELLSVLPVIMSILLLLAQRRLALALDFLLKRISGFNLLGDMYSLRAQSDLEEGQSDREPATNAPQSLSSSQSNNLNKEKESMGDIRNALLVVAALIASATYQVVFHAPSFLTNASHNSKKSFWGIYASWVTGPLGRDLVYIVFMSGNTFGLLVSVQMIICLTRDLPVRLPLLISVTTMVLTYYCFIFYLPFSLLDKAFGLKNVELLCVLPLTISILLLMVQRWVALALDFYLKRVSQFNIVGDMYSLRT